MTKARKRKIPETRRNEILQVAIELSKKIGYSNITRNLVADKAGASRTLVTLYFNPIDSLRRAVMKEAITKEILPILAQGLSLNDTLARRVSSDLKNKVAEYLLDK